MVVCMMDKGTMVAMMACHAYLPNGLEIWVVSLMSRQSPRFAPVQKSDIRPVRSLLEGGQAMTCPQV